MLLTDLIERLDNFFSSTVDSYRASADDACMRLDANFTATPFTTLAPFLQSTFPAILAADAKNKASTLTVIGDPTGKDIDTQTVRVLMTIVASVPQLESLHIKDATLLSHDLHLLVSALQARATQYPGARLKKLTFTRLPDKTDPPDLSILAECMPAYLPESLELQGLHLGTRQLEMLGYIVTARTEGEPIHLNALLLTNCRILTDRKHTTRFFQQLSKSMLPALSIVDTTLDIHALEALQSPSLRVLEFRGVSDTKHDSLTQQLPDILRNCSQLTHLKLPDLGLDDEFLGRLQGHLPTNLEVLDLSENPCLTDITTLCKLIKSLQKLHTLNMSECALQPTDDQVHRHRNTVTLSVANSEDDQAARCLAHIQRLDLSDNKALRSVSFWAAFGDALKKGLGYQEERHLNIDGCEIVYTTLLHLGVRGLRVTIPKEFLNDRYLRATEDLSRAGAIVTNPHPDYVIPRSIPMETGDDRPPAVIHGLDDLVARNTEADAPKRRPDEGDEQRQRKKERTAAPTAARASNDYRSTQPSTGASSSTKSGATNSNFRF